MFLAIIQQYFIIVSEINNFAYYKASGGCARILQGNMPLSAAKIRRSKRQNEKSFVVYYIYSPKNGRVIEAMPKEEEELSRSPFFLKVVAVYLVTGFVFFYSARTSFLDLRSVHK